MGGREKISGSVAIQTTGRKDIEITYNENEMVVGMGTVRC